MFVSAMQPQLLPLIGTLSDQNQSIYEYLQVLEAKVHAALFSCTFCGAFMLHGYIQLILHIRSYL